MESEEASARSGGRFALGGLAAIGLVLAGVLILGDDGTLQLLDDGWSWLKRAPAPVFFGAMTLAILLPVPATVFYFTAGPIFGVPQALGWIVFVLAANALLVHAVASSVLRPKLARLAERRGVRIPQLERSEDQLLFLLVMRVTPGIPYFVQSWAVALAGIDRLRFVVVSVLVQMFYAAGFVVLGRSAFEGRLGGVGLAVAFLAVGGLVARSIHRRLRAAGGDAMATSVTRDDD